MDLRELSRLVLATLDQQRRHFKTRAPADLDESKAMERRLRRAAERCLGPETPPLFDLGPGED